MTKSKVAIIALSFLRSSEAHSGLLWGKHAREHEQRKRKRECDQVHKKKPIKAVEKETRDKGLETKIGHENKGFALLQKMGYKSGDGLGKYKTGRTEPVPISVKTNKAGLGQEAHEKRKREARVKFRSILLAKKRKENETMQVVRKILPPLAHLV